MKKQRAQVLDTFLKFCYCFPYDIEDRFISTFGESLGTHFHQKFQKYCDKKENTFVAMIYTVGNMSTDNKALFIQMVDNYNNECT